MAESPENRDISCENNRIFGYKKNDWYEIMNFSLKVEGKH